MSFFENANVPPKEVGLISRANDIRSQIDLEEEPEATAEAVVNVPSALPWWIGEKMAWTTNAAGRSRLSPLPEYLRAVEQDAPKLVEYGAKLLRPENGGGSTEADILDSLRDELPGVIESMAALDDRERQAFIRFLVDRATRNAVYAATTQFEIDSWTRRAASKGEDPGEHQNFGQKESRRDAFATLAAAFAELVRELMPSEALNEVTYGKTARQVIYQNASYNERDLLQPSEEKARAGHAVQAAVLASRPI